MVETPQSAVASGQLFGGANGSIYADEKKDPLGQGRPRTNSAANAWLPPGTRQEETWRPRDMVG